MEISSFQLEEYKAELFELEKLLEKQNVEKEEARALGDLSENAEYEAARMACDKTSFRIKELRNKISSPSLTVIPPDDGPRIGVGSFVLINLLSPVDPKFVPRILRVDYEGDTRDPDPRKRVLSTDSTLGRALINSVSGEYTIHEKIGELKYSVQKLTQSLALKMLKMGITNPKDERLTAIEEDFIGQAETVNVFAKDS